MKLVLEEKPVAKARHRFRKGRKKPYDPQCDKKMIDRLKFKMQMIDKRFLKLSTGPLSFSSTFGIPMPRSWSVGLKNKRRGYPCSAHRGDLDNFVKYYADVLNGVAYSDDACISRIHAEKIYVDEPFVEININIID